MNSFVFKVLIVLYLFIQIVSLRQESHESYESYESVELEQTIPCIKDIKIKKVVSMDDEFKSQVICINDNYDDDDDEDPPEEMGKRFLLGSNKGKKDDKGKNPPSGGRPVKLLVKGKNFIDLRKSIFSKIKKDLVVSFKLGTVLSSSVELQECSKSWFFCVKSCSKAIVTFPDFRML